MKRGGGREIRGGESGFFFFRWGFGGRIDSSYEWLASFCFFVCFFWDEEEEEEEKGEDGRCR